MKINNKETDEDLAFRQDASDMHYRANLKIHMEQTDQFRRNKGKAYADIIMCCNKTMKDCIESNPDFTDKIMNDPVKLLQAICR